MRANEMEGISSSGLSFWNNEALRGPLLDELDSPVSMDLETLELHERARQGLSRTYSEEMES